MEAFFKTLSHSRHNNTKTQGAKLGGRTKLQAVQVDYFVLNKANTLCGPFVASDVYFQFHKSLGMRNFTRVDGHWCVLLFSHDFLHVCCDHRRIFTRSINKNNELWLESGALKSHTSKLNVCVKFNIEIIVWKIARNKPTQFHLKRSNTPHRFFYPYLLTKSALQWHRIFKKQSICYL